MIRFTPDQAAIAALDDPDQIVGRAVAKAGDRALDRARGLVDTYGRVDTGALRGSLRVEVENTADGTVAHVVAGVDYAIFVHEGTSRLEPSPFLTDALRELSVGDFT